LAETIGRFAPTPSGDLHFGSLVAAVGSFLSAKAKRGRWLLRIEDIDLPRVVRGSSDRILKQLEAFSLFYDGEVLYQSKRIAAYCEALSAIEKLGLLYECRCSRKTQRIHQNFCPAPIDGRIKPSIRIKTADSEIFFKDRLSGGFSQNLLREVGDFVLLRADGIFTYQLAVVVDDEYSGVTEVVRGRDLLDSTPRQIYLQRALKYREIGYAHLPLVLGSDGNKLSKQNLAEAIDIKNGSEVLVKALRFLGFKTPIELKYETTEAILAWALKNCQQLAWLLDDKVGE
jgi:glutamyl-Q tRNA(Asp) synthetase